MKYTSNFYSLNGDKYDVTIVTQHNESTSREITLGVSPFVTQMDTSDENIYKPLKLQGATVKIITDNESDYMFDLYSGEANGTRVTLSKSGQTIWDGFATPVVYQNGYSEIHEELELECIDGLSILQYYKYNSETKKVLSFIDIVNKILQRAEVYTTLYVSDNTRLTRATTTPILNDLFISEQNFFDEKKDAETDDDVAWTCEEVLSEICQYLGFVCVGQGDSVYFLDPDAIKNNVNTYNKYNIGSTSYTKVNLSNLIQISEDNYKGGANTISLDNVYNKISVKDSFYTFDSVIPDLYKTATNITKATDPDIASSTNINNGMYGEVVTGSDGKMIALIDRIYDPQDGKYTDYNVLFVKYYVNDNYNFTCPDELNYTDSKTMHGSVITKICVKKLDKPYSWWEQQIADITGHRITLDSWLAKNEISNPTFTNYVALLNPIQNHVNSPIPWITTNTNETTALFGGENAYLLIKGSYNYHYFDEDPYPIPEDEADISEGRYAMEAGQTYLLAKLKWGNQYWDGGNWTTTDTTFKIPYLADDSSGDERRADATMFHNINFLNTVSWRIGTSEKGLAIKCPTTSVMNGLPELTIYSPYDPDYYSTKSGSSQGKWYKHTRVFLKDFDVVAIIGDPTFSGENDSDTIYTNVIDNNHVQDIGEVDFKICTNDNKAPNYSSVAKKDGNNFLFLTETFNQALNVNNIQEKHYINKFCGQYKNPRIRLKLELNVGIKPFSVITDKWLPNKRFIIDSQSYDFYNDVSEITLVEKG